MATLDERLSLERAEGFMSDLEADRQTAPLEFVLLIETYAPRLEESIQRFKERRISGRELEAHAFQIRLSYARDLERLLATEPTPSARWIRTRHEITDTSRPPR